MTEARKLPAADVRVETGPVQFGDDWPGVFIRGDDAFGFLAALKGVMEDPGNEVSAAMVMGLMVLLASSDLTGVSKRFVP